LKNERDEALDVPQEILSLTFRNVRNENLWSTKYDNLCL